MTLSVSAALRRALRDMYEQSWRLVILNSALCAAVLAVLLLASYVPIALVLGIGVGPLVAALMHCAVSLVRDRDLRLGCALVGVRLHWLRGLQLAALAGLVVVPGVTALRAYGTSGAFAWPLAFVVAYLLALFVVFQVLIWPLAVAEPDRALADVLTGAATALVRRPGASIGLALALLFVNVLGAAAGILPLLTITVAYSFLAAAHFALPRQLAEGRP